MAECGAKVLNAQAVEFAKEKGIAIYARATSSPWPGAEPPTDGTVVRKNPPRMPGTVVGVASERDVLVLEADADSDQLLETLDEHHVAGKQLHMSIEAARTSLVISRENLHDEAKVRGALTSRFGGRIRVVDGLGAVSAIGAGINVTHANIRAGSSALREAGIGPRNLSTSSFRITWMVPSANVEKAVNALHARLIESSAPAVP
jgi:aspartate kinase